MNRQFRQTATAVVLCLQVTGCTGAAAQMAELKREVADLQRENRGLLDTVKAQQETIERQEESLSNLRKLGGRRVEEIYCVGRIEIDRLSRGADYDQQVGDDGVTVYLNLYDREDHKFKAAGSIRVSIYDLVEPGQPELIADYEFDARQAKALWQGRLLTYHFKIKCPWQKRPPRGREVYVKVTFEDHLTGVVHEDAREIELTPTAAPAPQDDAG